MQHMQSYSAFRATTPQALGDVDLDAEVDFGDGDDDDDDEGDELDIMNYQPRETGGFHGVVNPLAAPGGDRGVAASSTAPVAIQASSTFSSDKKNISREEYSASHPVDADEEDRTQLQRFLSRKQSSKRRSTFHVEGADEDYAEDEHRFLVDEDEEDAHGETPQNDAQVEDEEMQIDEADMVLSSEGEDPIEVFRKELQALQTNLHFEEWDVLDRRQQLSGMIEPMVLGDLDIPPNVMFYARIYSVAQAAFALLLPYSLLMLTGVPTTKAMGGFIFTICTAGGVLDIILRIATYLPRRSKGSIGFDIVICIASLLAVADPSTAGGMFVYVSMLRATRAFRFVYLFRDQDTFRDIYLVQKTIADSSAVLLILCLFAFIAVFISSTFLWASESSYYDHTLQAWIRQCSAEVPCTSIASPFQSIPSAMWLAFNCVTLTGYGDTWPVTAMGRVFAGLTCVCGVFAIAFPTTVLLGNLSIVRETFFKEIEIREARIIAEATERITEQVEAEERAAAAAAASSPASPSPRLAIMAKHIAEMVKTPEEELEDSQGSIPLGGLSDDHELVEQQLRVAHRVANMPTHGTFYFMGPEARAVMLTDIGLYYYLPIMQVVLGHDRLPLIGNVTRIDSTTSAVTLFLCIDDAQAQRTAARALGDEFRFAARSVPIVSMSASLDSAHPALSLFRRVDVGEVHDNYVPLVFLVRSAHRFGNLTRLRKAFLGTKLNVAFTPSISAAAVWSESVFITAEMMCATKFIAELKSRSVLVAPTIFFNQEEKDEVDDEDLILKKRRNIAFIQPSHIYQLLDGVFDKIVVPEGAGIRNRSEILDAILELILLHSRDLYFKDIPPIIHSAVFALDEITLYDRVVEVDLEFFRKSEWPIGTVEVLFGYTSQALEVVVSVDTSAAEGEQPEFEFSHALNVEYSLEDEDAAEESVPPPEEDQWSETSEAGPGGNLTDDNAQESGGGHIGDSRQRTPSA